MMIHAVVLGLALVGPAAAAGVSDLSFMSGCWRSPPEAAVRLQECYTVPWAGVIQGSSQTVKDGAFTAFEFTLIEEKDGAVTLMPFVNGVRSVSFALVRSGTGEAVFENLAHDFPKRIIYRKGADGALTARIEGAQSDEPGAAEWTMRPMQ
ncbi:MAG: DUF6265 family protein [Rhodospirillaceae bacterium]|nr:DUF6265 family protein [Rhodospirillaceae bacterium]